VFRELSEGEHCSGRADVAPMLPVDRYAATATDRSRRRYEKEQSELDHQLRWLQEDEHYHMPGGYGATNRMKALPWPKFEWVSAEQQRGAVEQCMLSITAD
jgi:hypothetical protein